MAGVAPKRRHTKNGSFRCTVSLNIKPASNLANFQEPPVDLRGLLMYLPSCFHLNAKLSYNRRFSFRLPLVADELLRCPLLNYASIAHQTMVHNTCTSCKEPIPSREAYQIPKIPQSEA